MTIPDPDDPDFASEIRELAIYLFGAVCFLLAVLSLGIAFLSH